MKAIHKILATIMIVAAVATAFVACNKEKETKDVQQTMNVKTPIAVRNINSDNIMYNVPLSKIQGALDDYTASKRIGDVIVESWSITDDETTENPVLKLSIIDVDSESSSKIAMYNAFIERTFVGDSVEYYLTDLVLSGNYSYITSDAEDTYLVTVENNEVVSIELYNAKSPWTGGVTVSCKKESGCQYNRECYPYPQGCSGCVNGKCVETISETYLTSALTAFN